MVRDCAQEAAGATGRLDHTNMPEPIEHVVSEHFGRPEGREPLVKSGISALRVQRREALLIEKIALRGNDQPVGWVRSATRLSTAVMDCGPRSGEGVVGREGVRRCT